MPRGNDAESRSVSIEILIQKKKRDVPGSAGRRPRSARRRGRSRARKGSARPRGGCSPARGAGQCPPCRGRTASRDRQWWWGSGHRASESARRQASRSWLRGGKERKDVRKRRDTRRNIGGSAKRLTRHQGAKQRKKTKAVQRRTNFNTEAVHAHNKDVRRGEALHGLMAKHVQLTRVEPLVNSFGIDLHSEKSCKVTEKNQRLTSAFN